jgi:hypothetical protein
MSLGKKFFNDRSRLTPVQQPLASNAVAACRVLSLPLPFKTRQSGAEQAPDAESRELGSFRRSPRAILGAGFGLISKAVMRCAVCIDLTFTNLPLAVLSWLMTQFFVGCAAYAEAMYPSVGYAGSTEALDRIESMQRRPVEEDHVGLSPQLAPDLTELRAYAMDAAGYGGNGNIVRLNVPRKTSSRRIASTALVVTRWLSRRRGLKHTRPVTIELRSYDRRTLRGDPMPRYGTE